MKYKLRVSGSNDFVSKIDPEDSSCWPKGSVDYVDGWDNPGAIIYDDKEAAQAAAEQAEIADGVPCCIEEHRA